MLSNWHRMPYWCLGVRLWLAFKPSQKEDFCIFFAVITSVYFEFLPRAELIGWLNVLGSGGLIYAFLWTMWRMVILVVTDRTHPREGGRGREGPSPELEPSCQWRKQTIWDVEFPWEHKNFLKPEDPEGKTRARFFRDERRWKETRPMS